MRSLEEVSPELKQDIATERAKTQITSVYDKIEDVRSIGKTLAEAAEGLKLEVPQGRGRPLRPRSLRPAGRTCPMRSGC